MTKEVLNINEILSVTILMRHFDVKKTLLAYILARSCLFMNFVPVKYICSDNRNLKTILLAKG